MFRSTRTIYNVQLESCKMINKPYIPESGTTLNEIYSKILVPPSTDSNLYTLGYYMCGIDYSNLIPNNDFTLDTASHEPTDANLFNPLPFILRKKSVGLTNEEKSNYVLIVDMTINGEMYEAGILKKVTKVDDNGSLLILSKDINYRGKKLADMGIDYSKPTPKVGLNLYPTELQYAGYSHTMTVTLSALDVSELKKSADIMYGNLPESQRYRLAEFGFFTGIETTDGIANTQLGFTVKSDHLMEDKAISEVLNIGGMSPYALRN